MKRRALILLPLLFLTNGCGGVNKEDLVGNWSGTLEMSDTALDAATKQAQITSGRAITKEEVKAAINSTGSALTLNSDDTFSMNLGPAVYAGKWSVSSKTVALTVETLMGMSIDEASAKLKFDPSVAQQLKAPMKLNLSNGNKKLDGVTPDDPGTKIVFTKP